LNVKFETETSMTHCLLNCLLNVCLPINRQLFNRLPQLFFGSVLLATAALVPTVCHAQEDESPYAAWDGQWEVVAVTERGREEKVEDETVTIAEETLTIEKVQFKMRPPSFGGPTSNDAPPSPYNIIDVNLIYEDSSIRLVMKGLGELKEDRLTLCFAAPDKERPLRLEINQDDSWELHLQLQRK